jgi:MFS superfamily molybdate transporter
MAAATSPPSSPPPVDVRPSGLAGSLLATLSQARINRNEIAGALGDLGSFLPLLVGMAVQSGLDLAAALFFAGLFNVIAGLTFTIPIAVQPMKAIAAAALTGGLTVQEIHAAGATVGFVILVLGVTGLIGWLNRVVPKSVVRGLQLALGLSILMKGLQMVAGTGHVVGPDSYLTGTLAAFGVLALFLSRRVPAALLLFAAGVLLALVFRPDVIYSLEIGMTLPTWNPPRWADFMSAFPKAALSQIPLTTLNSVIGVCALSADLFPNRVPTPRRVAMSIGLVNLVVTPFGGMPMCHGSGGLAAQYRFGARTNGSILFLGVAKMTVAVLFGASLMAFCRAFPASILGVMLAFSGMELALVTRDQTRRGDAFTMLFTAATCLGLNNIALGLGLGLGLAWCQRLSLIHLDEEPSATPNGASDHRWWEALRPRGRSSAACSSPTGYSESRRFEREEVGMSRVIRRDPHLIHRRRVAIAFLVLFIAALLFWPFINRGPDGAGSSPGLFVVCWVGATICILGIWVPETFYRCPACMRRIRKATLDPFKADDAIHYYCSECDFEWDTGLKEGSLALSVPDVP